MNRRAFASRMAGGCSGIWLESELRSQSCNALPAQNTATPFTLPPAPPVVKRPSVADLAALPAELARFRLAVQRMKSLPGTDRRQFARQVNLHCNHCGVQAAQEIHRNWAFLPWHRAMLYFHERILNNLVPAGPGESPIRIPYWPWDNFASAPMRTTPAIYAATGQSLFAVRNPLRDLTRNQVNVEPALALRRNEDFLGTATISPATFTGPHANVHNWARAILSDLKFSPLDPLFYAHHANIDRMWASWIALADGRTNPDFGSLTGYFFDENGQWRSIVFNGLRDTKAVGYEYSSLMTLATPSAPVLFSVRMNNAVVDGVNDATSAVKGHQSNFLLLRGVKLGALAKESRFGVFAGGQGANLTVDSQYFLGSFSTVKPIEADIPSGLTVVVPAKNLRTILGQKPVLRIFALDENEKVMGNGIPLQADNVSLM